MLKHVHFFVFKKLLLKVCIAYIYMHVTVDIFFFFLTIIITNVNEKNTYIYNKKIIQIYLRILYIVLIYIDKNTMIYVGASVKNEQCIQFIW